MSGAIVRGPNTRNPVVGREAAPGFLQSALSMVQKKCSPVVYEGRRGSESSRDLGPRMEVECRSDIGAHSSLGSSCRFGMENRTEQAPSRGCQSLLTVKQ